MCSTVSFFYYYYYFTIFESQEPLFDTGTTREARYCLLLDSKGTNWSKNKIECTNYWVGNKSFLSRKLQTQTWPFSTWFDYIIGITRVLTNQFGVMIYYQINPRLSFAFSSVTTLTFKAFNHKFSYGKNNFFFLSIYWN